MLPRMSMDSIAQQTSQQRKPTDNRLSQQTETTVMKGTTEPAAPGSHRGQLLALAEVQAITRLGASTIYKGVAEGWFPQARKIGPRSARWIEAELLAWIEDLPRAASNREAA